MTESLAEIVRQRREELGHGQEDLAELLGVAQQTVSRWETGQALPRPRRIDQLAQVLRLDRDRLYRAVGYVVDDRSSGDPVEWLRSAVGDATELELIELIDAAWGELRERRRTARMRS